MVNTSKRLKGFTLIEMVVVIGIITALLAVLAPTMSTYFWKSRVKTANSNARMVYNAAQTAVQKYVSYDRTAGTSSPFSRTPDSIVVISYSGETGTFEYSLTDSKPATNGGSATDTSVTRTAGTDKEIADVVRYVNKIVSGASERNWAVYIDKYTVKASVEAEFKTTNCIGYYSVGTITVERLNDMKNKSGGAYAGTNYGDAYFDVLKDKASYYTT